MDDITNLIQYIQGFIPEKSRTKNKNDSINDSIFDKAITYSVMAPLIVDQRWPEVSDDLKLKAKAWRMKDSLQCIREEMATEFDAMVYLHTASLAQPFTGQWYNIYFYLFKKYYPEQAEQLNIQVTSLDKYEETLLNKLRTWIFKHQMNAVKQRVNRGEILYTGLFSYSILFGWLGSFYLWIVSPR